MTWKKSGPHDAALDAILAPPATTSARFFGDVLPRDADGRIYLSNMLSGAVHRLVAR